MLTRRSVQKIHLNGRGIVDVRTERIVAKVGCSEAGTRADIATTCELRGGSRGWKEGSTKHKSPNIQEVRDSGTHGPEFGRCRWNEHLAGVFLHIIEYEQYCSSSADGSLDDPGAEVSVN